MTQRYAFSKAGNTEMSQKFCKVTLGLKPLTPGLVIQRVTTELSLCLVNFFKTPVSHFGDYVIKRIYHFVVT